ncbi:hypothetical protein [Bianquea renquensis]|jgi:hypothetical protein|uniref:Glycosyltransferase n=1 Tax=Bianquea renquensis TaxID=2763661 RepID=A0A926DQW4_9FIRM|nr:hypothetical protein [Bianquea renquensis]MBC8542398.1 hypothetical protein [Bianquea renquensis]
MNLLAVVGDYYPFPSSNTNCFDPLLHALEANKWSIDIVTVRKSVDLPKYEKEANGREIWRIEDPRSMNTILYNRLNEIPAPKVLKLLNRLFAFISKGVFYLYYCIGKHDKIFSGWLQNDTVNKCVQLHQEKKYDVVLSISHPVTCHEIAKKFLRKLNANNRPKWILYEFDPYCYNEHIYGKGCYKKLSSHQHELFDACDAIYLIPELYEFYKETPFNRYMNKMIPIGFPNMKPVSINHQNVKPISIVKDKVSCVYGGALGAKIRNPQYALNTFVRCTSNINFIIMTGYPIEVLLQKINDPNKIITVHGLQNRDTSYDTMLRADILVSIGNAVSFQTPGKIFEYMSMGKPIIHFQKIDQDPCLKYLQDYPMVLIIDEREIDVEEHARRIDEFAEKYRGKNLTFEEVAKCIPQYTSRNVTASFVASVNKLVNEV